MGVLHELTTRQKAAAILSGRKLQMLEEAGLVVIDAQEYKTMRRALEAIAAIIRESEGVSGYHLNGELATWDELGIEKEVTMALEAMDRNGSDTRTDRRTAG